MAVFTKILATVLPVFGIIALGFFYSKRKQIPAKELSELIMWIMIPCLVLGSIGSQSISFQELIHIGAAALIVVLGCGLLTLVLLAKKSHLRAALLSSMFMNSANMAFPLALLALGADGLARQVVFYIAINLMHVTIGIALARGRGGLKEVFRLPLVYFSIIAISLATNGIILPNELVEPLSLVGKATIPLMLMMLGARLRGFSLSQIGQSILVSMIRILGGFGLGLFAVWLFDLQGVARGAVLIGAAMPAAVLNFIFSEKYSLMPEFVATNVVISTLISFGTTPLVIWYLIS